MPVHSDNGYSRTFAGSGSDVRYGIRIPMRDGARLNGMLFRPRGTDKPAPIVYEMTPYGIDAFYAVGQAFAAAGLAFILIDSRGRGDSEGEFEMFEIDVNDTVDVIDWLSRQEWCDGQVASYGGSYSGVNQWTAAKSAHPALKTITPWAAAYPGIDVPSGGIPFIGHVSWHLLTSGHDTYWQMGADSGYWAELLATIYRENRPASDLLDMAGITRPKFREVLEDPFYAMKAMTFLPTDEEIAAMDMPILSSTGHYDSCHPGTLYHFLRYEACASEAARKKHCLVIGPWLHADMGGGDSVGELSFLPQARVDMDQVRYEWFRWAFGKGEKPAFLTHRIMYYMAGAEEWRGCDTLDEAFSTHKVFYLASDGNAADIFHSGHLGGEPGDSAPDSYVSDPFDTGIVEMELRKRPLARPEAGATTIKYPDPLRGLQWQIAGEDPTDPAYAYNLRGQGVIYHSAPLETELEIAGIPELELWMTIDTPDTDVVALLYEILPDDGTSILLWSNLLRLRYRNSWREPEPVKPGEPFRFTFLMPKFMSRRLRKGSRLRLVVRAPGSIQYEKNLNAAPLPIDQRPDDARVCTALLHHSGDMQSVLRLPVNTPDLPA